MGFILKVFFWLFLWPIALPFWLWNKGIVGRIIAGIWTLVLVFGLSRSPSTTNAENQTALVSTPLPQLAVIAAPAESRSTFTPTPMPTAVTLIAESTPVTVLQATPAAIDSAASTLQQATSTPTEVAIPTTLSLPTSGPSCSDIVQSHRALTSAQWESYTETLKGSGLLSWVGRVYDVGDWSILDFGYPIQIQVSPDCWVYYVAEDEQRALQLVLGEEVIVNGQIEFVADIFGSITIYPVEEVTSIGTSASVATPVVQNTTANGQPVSSSPPASAIVASNANLRSGPGTNYDVVGGLLAGQPIEISGCNETCDWYQLTNGSWIAATLIQTQVSSSPNVVATKVEQPTTPSEPSVVSDEGDSNLLYEPKIDGFYLVGVDIAPGKWESTGFDATCYWQSSDQFQEINKNHLGSAGGTFTIQPTDYEVQFQRCGTWYYVEGRTPSLQSDASSEKNDGFYTVGVEIMPGTWRSSGPGDTCYWQRLDGNQEILANHLGLAGGTMTILPTDYEVSFERCGTWTYLGQ